MQETETLLPSLRCAAVLRHTKVRMLCPSEDGPGAGRSCLHRAALRGHLWRCVVRLPEKALLAFSPSRLEVQFAAAISGMFALIATTGSAASSAGEQELCASLASRPSTQT